VKIADIAQARAKMRHIENLCKASTGCNLQEILVLSIVRHNPLTTHTQIAVRLDVSQPSASVACARAIEAGLLRVEEAFDGRARPVTITQHGLETLRKFEGVLKNEDQS